MGRRWTMSEIKALEKLRECANHESAGFFVNLEQAFGLSRYKCGDSTVKPNGGMILNAIADEIEAEISDRYMLLPMDTDGVPIRVGDICKMNDERFEVRQLRTDGDYWWAVDRLGEFYMAKFCRHVKSRTLEDIVQDAIQYGFSYGKAGMDVSEQRDKYADEIRELLGGDAS